MLYNVVVCKCGYFALLLVRYSTALDAVLPTTQSFNIYSIYINLRPYVGQRELSKQASTYGRKGKEVCFQVRVKLDGQRRARRETARRHKSE